ncbi:MAG TPA: hypothetical protein DCZ40_11110 [Lachnospiraceae bacterium]|nr:hypothetical protein [Lachnospiraceae bacterium]
MNMGEGRIAGGILAVAGSLLLCGCSNMRTAVNETREEIPVEAVMEEMAEMMGEKEDEVRKAAEDEEYWSMESAINTWLMEGLTDTEPEGEMQERDADAYKITDKPDEEGEYLALTSEEGACYIRRPANRQENSYLESEGAFRFEIPHTWIWGSCDLDTRLDAFWEDEDVPCLLWGIEDNDMGKNAFSKDWEGVCASIRNTAETVFGENMVDFTARKYSVEEGEDVYNFRCAFHDERGYLWVVTAAYRFGEKYMLEFIGIKQGEGDANIENMALYTAVTYEEYGGDRYREYEGEGHYKGMDIWDYKKFHNPFVLAYAQANGKEWTSAE